MSDSFWLNKEYENFDPNHTPAQAREYRSRCNKWPPGSHWRGWEVVRVGTNMRLRKWLLVKCGYCGSNEKWVWPNSPSDTPPCCRSCLKEVYQHEV